MITIFRSLQKLCAVSLLFVFTVTAQSLNGSLPPDAASNSITANDLKKHLRFIASDELGGRYTLSQGNRIAARYIATHLESYGYRPAARDGSFFQRVPLAYRQPDVAQSLCAISGEKSKSEFKYGDDFVTETPQDTHIKGELVFVGYGISSPVNQHDDYAGLNVKGKIVVGVTGAPKSLQGKALNEHEAGLPAAVAHGAIGAIIMPPAEQMPSWDFFKTFALRENLGLPPNAQAPYFLAGINLVKMIAAALNKEHTLLLAPAGNALPPAKLNLSAEIKVKVTVKDAPPAQNVAAILEGTDARLKDEYVVVSAHLDHLETTNNEIYNGADDDGSGIVSVLEIAEALSLAHPRRSILIMFHTGEELGLFGSEYNTDYEPLVPLAKIVTNLNLDMVGRSRLPENKDPRDKNLTDKDSIYIIGADRLSTELHKLNEATNGETAKLRLDYKYNDPNDQERLYYRSDHYNYAKHGIPIIFYFTGLHRDYHQATDVVEKIDFDKMQRVSRMIFAVAWRAANADHRLVVDKKAGS